MYEKFVKRFLDILISLTGIILLSPILLILWILVRTKLGSPVLFKQKRPGKNGEIFELCKFRSMTDERDGEGNLLPDEVRLTSFGKKLRASSLDELPELFNILKGDMSLIGPRPLLVKYLPYYSEEESHRHDIRPGLTGLAQVNGRNAIGWEDRFRYDLEYVRNLSFSLDFKILFMTVGKVLNRSGVLSGEEQTTIDFDIYRKRQQEEKNSEKEEGTLKE